MQWSLPFLRTLTPRRPSAPNARYRRDNELQHCDLLGDATRPCATLSTPNHSTGKAPTPKSSSEIHATSPLRKCSRRPGPKRPTRRGQKRATQFRPTQTSPNIWAQRRTRIEHHRFDPAQSHRLTAGGTPESHPNPHAPPAELRLEVPRGRRPAIRLRMLLPR